MSNESIDVFAQLDSIDLSSVETAKPMLSPGLYDVIVAKVETADVKPPKVGKLLKITLTLTQPAQSVPNDKGETQTINAGYPIFDQISLSKTFDESGQVKYDPLPALARFREATIGDKSGQFLPLEQYIGRQVKIQVAYDSNSKGKDGQEFGPKNSIKRYVKASA